MNIGLHPILLNSCNLQVKKSMTNSTSYACDLTAMCYPRSPAAANLPCLTGSSTPGGVRNSLVLPVHIWVPHMLRYGISVPWCTFLRLTGSVFVDVHSCNPAPRKWRTLSRFAGFVFLRLPAAPGGPCLSSAFADHNPHRASERHRTPVSVCSLLQQWPACP